MALRDSFGFLTLPRAGLEGSFLEARSHHEAPASAARGASRVRLPEDVGNAAALEQAVKKLGSLKEVVRSEPPASNASRRTLWYLGSGGWAKQQAAPVPYSQLAASARQLKDDVIMQIDTDVRAVGLTFRQHPLYKTAPGVTAMSNVLVALMASNPRLGYTRQLTHIVAFTLVVFGGADHQEAVFWTIKALLEDKLFSYCDGQWLFGVRVEQEVLSRLAAKKFPRLVAHLASMRLSVGTFTQSWLSGLFVSHLPPETVARVWDATMLEGSKVLLRTGLALLKMYEQTMSSCTFPEVLRKVLDLRVSRTTDAAALMSAAFRGCGSLPGTQVDTLRQEALKQLRDSTGAGAPDGIARSSPSQTGLVRAASPTSPAGSSGGASTGARGLFGVGSVSFKSRVSSGRGSSGTSPPSGPASALSVPASPVGSDSGGEVSERSREPSPVEVRPTAAVVLGVVPPALPRSRSTRALVGAQLSSMLSRFMGGGTKTAAIAADGVSDAGVTTGLRRSATAGNMSELAAC